MKDITLLKGKIHYVGVNDRSTHLFEGMWPIPYGVSYNSYLIDDEKVALVDTVELGYFDIFLQHIKAILGEKPIDYLIVNHMEPDHSSSIALIKQYYPEVTIVGNVKTFGMIDGYYGVESKRLVVKEGDTITVTMGESIDFQGTTYPIQPLPQNLMDIINAGGLVKAMQKRNGILEED